MWIIIFQRIFFDFFWDILYFPIWWYSGGARHAFLVSRNFFREGNEVLAPMVWLKNVFVPMFGQYDWQGRIMSFFMRVINIIIRSIFLLVWFVLAALIFFLWLAFPLFVLFMIRLSV